MRAFQLLCGLPFLLVSTALGGGPATAEPELVGTAAPGSPIGDALAQADADVRTFDDHVVTLANPYFEGRLPGTRGMELAKDYVEHHYKKLGLVPAFSADGEAFSTYRQPFDLGGTWQVNSEKLGFIGEHDAGEMGAGTDFVTTALGKSGEVFGGAVFIGYAIDDGPDGYSSFASDTNLKGKVAVMLRFEPVDGEGSSKWGENGQWSERAGFEYKLKAAGKRGAAAIIVINTPGVKDDRTDRLVRFGGWRSLRAQVPVLMLSTEAGERLVGSGLGEDAPSLLELRQHADEGGEPIDLNTIVSIEADAKAERVRAENLGGVIHGAGDLADEWIVIGAHLDHLGHGQFGSRRGAGEIHPGADDNASGSAGVLLAAELIARRFAEMPADIPRRSVLFMHFTGEESGLNGSKYYVSDPIVALDKHMLMINWDMIGRIQQGRAAVSGTTTGEGLAAFCQSYFDASGLDISVPESMSGASDHASFYNAGVPVLFGMEADIPDEYHTPDDLSWTINRTSAVAFVRTFVEMLPTLATRGEGFAYQKVSMASASPVMGKIKVRFGIMPASYTEEDPGVPVGGVSPDSPAEMAGIERGDRLMRWDGTLIDDIGAWMMMLADHKPGDEVMVGVVREGQELTFKAVLQGKGG